MKKLYQTWPFNFGAIHHQDFKKAKIVIVPVPYEGTSSFGGGTREGPYAILRNSRYLDELWDNLGDQLVGLKATDIFTFDEVEVSFSSSREAVEGVRQVIENEVIKYDKIPLMLGGEHLITLGAVMALKKKYQNLSILQVDAHLDLDDAYEEGSKYTHSCTMRRIRELGVKAVQVGMRNLNPAAKAYLRKEKITDVYFAPKMPLARILKGLSKNVYLTVDLDVFDPSIMPAVGTPEPGGLGWYEVLNLIEKVTKNKNIVGADVVELAPIPGSGAPDFLAAKLVYKIISYITK